MLGVYSHLIVLVIGYAASYLFKTPLADKELTIWGYLEERKKECGIPFWPHAFVRLADNVDVDRLVEEYMNEYGVLGYGSHLMGELTAFCEIMGIKVIKA